MSFRHASALTIALRERPHRSASVAMAGSSLPVLESIIPISARRASPPIAAGGAVAAAAHRLSGPMALRGSAADDLDEGARGHATAP